MEVFVINWKEEVKQRKVEAQILEEEQLAEQTRLCELSKDYNYTPKSKWRWFTLFCPICNCRVHNKMVTCKYHQYYMYEFCTACDWEIAEKRIVYPTAA